MPSAKGLVPENHPHFIGTYRGAVSTTFCARIVESADAYLFAGPIFNDYSSVGYSLLLKREKAIIVQPECVVIENGPAFGSNQLYFHELQTRYQMMMEVKVVSRESIKPSSPTPHHLRTFKLSLLDQLIPAPYAPLVFFYPTEDGATNLQVLKILQLLKKSLSENLTRFYPLAGKIEDDLTIDCNDVGAHNVEAEVNCHLPDFLCRPDLQAIHLFLPCETSFKGSVAGAPVTNIQVNIFECGRIAIGLCISHKILDGAALSSFVKGWSGTACGSKEVVYPDVIATSLFSTNDFWLRDSSIVMWGSLFKIGKCTTRRFAFDASAITTLKVKAASNSVQNPTQVEAVSAFMWKCAMAASEETHGFPKPSLLSHVVNLRRRTMPPLTEHSIGNLIWIASALMHS
ncbi:hypothetical protein ACSBR1_029288 [Camellia fascicularis]